MGVYTAAPPTIVNGEIPDATKFTQFTNFMAAVLDPWTPYTVTWSAGAGSPAVGNGTLLGRYRRLGKTVDFHVILTAGSTTTYGTAGTYWLFSLPPLSPLSRVVVISAFALDTAVKEWSLSAAAGYDGVNLISPLLNGGGRHLNNNPFTFGSTDKLVLNGTYETT